MTSQIKEKIISRINYMLENKDNIEHIHGRFGYCLENIAFSIGILNEAVFDKFFKDSKEIDNLYNYVHELFISDNQLIRTDFYQHVIASTMLFANRNINKDDDVFKTYFIQRLKRLYEFCVSKKEIFYDKNEKLSFKSIPAPWRNYNIVRFENTNPFIIIPQVYDLLSFSVMYENNLNDEVRLMIDVIINYIFSSKYQKDVLGGYGIGINEKVGFIKSRYFAVGWDIHLYDLSPSQELTYMILFSRITSARITKWYINNLNKYELFRNNNDYIFPKEYFINKETYWVSSSLNFGFTNNNIKDNSNYVMSLLK